MGREGDAELISSKILGDLKTQRFSEIVTGEDCGSFWDRVPVSCRICPNTYRDSCLGGCIAAADEYYPNSGHPDPLCEICAI